MKWRLGAVALTAGAMFLSVLPSAPWTSAQEAEPEGPRPDQVKEVVGHLVKPENRGFSEARAEQLRVPDGFGVNVFARDLGMPRMLAVSNDGTVYVTRRETDDVLALRDVDGDGRADATFPVVANLEGVHGITIHQGRLYLATVKEIYAAELLPDGSVGPLQLLVDDLPDGGQHPNRTIAFGPDGMLYVSVGSTCNACRETNEENATMIRAMPDGSRRTVIATGLRNTIGWGWHPETGQMWGMDHGSDWRGDDTPPEELNLIQEGGNYGWPYCYGDRTPDEYLAQDPRGTTKAQYCPTTVAPVVSYQAHSAPIGMVFYTGSQFPPEYRGDAFIAMRGSWNRNPPTGYKVVRLHFEDGWPTPLQDFLTGFLIEGGAAHFARLAGVAIAADGSLLVSDDTNGAIYRVSYGRSSST